MLKYVWNNSVKIWVWGAFVGFVFGTHFGAGRELDRLYKDCRHAGATRIGEAAFKCEQFSKVVLLTPDEQAKKEEKKK